MSDSVQEQIIRAARSESSAKYDTGQRDAAQLFDAAALAAAAEAVRVVKERQQDAIESLRRALHAAYTGSAEHGSFLRGGRGEYVPGVFMTLNNLEESIPALLSEIESVQQVENKEDSAGLAAVGNDTGRSETETASTREKP